LSKDTEALPTHYRWNSIAFLVDSICFGGVVLTLIDPTSVLPAFVRQLTDSEFVVGLISAIFRGGWLLPQLVAGRLINDKPRKKPYMLAGLGGRVFLWVIALALWARLDRNPTAMLVLSFTCIGLFAAFDGVVGVVWFDIIARAIPWKRRGRLMGFAQFISGLTGMGVGALVGLILALRSFPEDYALIFTLTAVAFIPSTIALALLREPQSEEVNRQANGHVRGGWLKPLVTNPAFRRLMVCRVLVGMMYLAAPFYVGYADDVLHLPKSVIGRFVIAQRLAGMVAGATLGLVSERRGLGFVIRIGSTAAAIGPLFALAVHIAGDGWLVQAYPFIYVILGVVNSVQILGFANYLLEMAPDGMRPVYIGLGNTITGALIIAPMIGGWLLEATSYATLFSVTAVIVAAGFLVSLGLGSPKQAAPMVEQP
jgi:MFS family permease